MGAARLGPAANRAPSRSPGFARFLGALSFRDHRCDDGDARPPAARRGRAGRAPAGLASLPQAQYHAPPGRAADLRVAGWKSPRWQQREQLRRMARHKGGLQRAAPTPHQGPPLFHVKRISSRAITGPQPVSVPVARLRPTVQCVNPSPNQQVASLSMGPSAGNLVAARESGTSVLRFHGSGNQPRLFDEEWQKRRERAFGKNAGPAALAKLFRI